MTPGWLWKNVMKGERRLLANKYYEKKQIATNKQTDRQTDRQTDIFQGKIALKWQNLEEKYTDRVRLNKLIIKILSKQPSFFNMKNAQKLLGMHKKQKFPLIPRKNKNVFTTWTLTQNIFKLNWIDIFDLFNISKCLTFTRFWH